MVTSRWNFSLPIKEIVQPNITEDGLTRFFPVLPWLLFRVPLMSSPVTFGALGVPHLARREPDNIQLKRFRI